MTLDINHECWTLICEFIPFDERRRVLELCKASVDSPARQNFFLQSTWRMPPAERLATRVVSYMTMQRFIKRVLINESWQQEYLGDFSALESLRVGKESSESIFVFVSWLPTALKKITLLRRYGCVEIRALARLVNLEDLEMDTNYVVDPEILATLPRLTRFKLGELDTRDCELACVGALDHLRELHVGDVCVNNELRRSMANVDTLVLNDCNLKNFDELEKIGPQLQSFFMTLWDSDYVISNQAVERFIRTLTNVERLSMDRVTSGSMHWLNAASTLTNLKVLDHGTSKVSDLSPLAALVHLEELSVCASDADWSPVANCTQLRKINQQARYTDVNSTSAPALQQLQYLSTLKRTFQLSGNQPLIHLTTLSITYGSSAAHVFPLGCCPDLEKLSMRNCAMDSESIVENFPKLKDLSYCNCENVDFRPLIRLEQLERLSVAQSWPVEDGIPSLGEMKHLKDLRLSGIGIADISMLGGLKQLRTLDLYCNKFTDISALAALRQLRALNLSSTECRDVSCLNGHPELRSLLLPSDADCSPLVTSYGLNLPQIVHFEHGGCNRNHWTRSP